MGVKLTNPIAHPNLTHQVVRRFRVEVPHKVNVANDDIVIDKDNIQLVYEVYTYEELSPDDSILADRQVVTVPFGDWPGVFKTSMQNVYNKIETDATNRGVIGAGTAEAINT